MQFRTDWELRPLHGANDLVFGMSRDDVLALLGAPEQPARKVWGSEATRIGWRKGAVTLFFAPDLEYIEFSRDSGLVVTLLGKPVFETPADELVLHVGQAGHAFDGADPELGYTFIFKDIQASLWRPLVPESPSDDEGRFFSTVGIGRLGYYE